MIFHVQPKLIIAFPNNLFSDILALCYANAPGMPRSPARLAQQQEGQGATGNAGKAWVASELAGLEGLLFLLPLG